MSIACSATLALLLAAAAPAPGDAPLPDTQSSARPAPEATTFKRVAIGFTPVAPADPAKRPEMRRAAPNREFAPLILMEQPDGTRELTHGPRQQLQFDLAPEPQPAPEQPQ